MLSYVSLISTLRNSSMTFKESFPISPPSYVVTIKQHFLFHLNGLKVSQSTRILTEHQFSKYSHTVMFLIMLK